jgi:acyl-coenzyme A synthetase/AMP-(fatty) acid ligase
VLVVDGDALGQGLSLEIELPKWPDMFEPATVDPAAVAAILLTSGATGMAKGAVQTLRSIRHAIRIRS